MQLVAALKGLKGLLGAVLAEHWLRPICTACACLCTENLCWPLRSPPIELGQAAVTTSCAPAACYLRRRTLVCHA